MPRKCEYAFSYHDVQNIAGIKVMKTSAKKDWQKLFVYTAKLEPFTFLFPRVDSLLISLVLKGKLNADIQINDNKYSLNLEPGAIIIVPPDVLIDVNLTTSLDVVNIYISKSLIDDVFDEFSIENIRYLDIYKFLYMYDPFLKQIVGLIRDILYIGGRFEALEAKNIVKILLSRIISKHSSFRLTDINFDGGLPIQTLQRIFDFIDCNLHRRILIDQLARMSGLGSAQFSRLFKRTTSITIHQYIIKMRVDRAQNLLIESKLSIAEIAHECGFADQVHLTRFFGRIVGTSPASFRKKFKG